MFSRSTALLVVGLLLMQARLAAALLVYDFGPVGTPTAGPTYLAPNLSAGAFSALSGGALSALAGVSGSAYEGDKGWNTSPGTMGSQVNYFTFTVTAQNGYQLDLSSLSFAVRSAGGPTSFQVRSSVDNFGSVIGSGSVSGSWSSSGAINLGAAEYQDLSTVTFRIYGYGDNNNGTGSLFLIDDVSLDGLVAVPEPTTVALCLFGVGFVLLASGRRVVTRRRRPSPPRS